MGFNNKPRNSWLGGEWNEFGYFKSLGINAKAVKNKNPINWVINYFCMPQSYYRLYYHLIWSTKRRLPIIDNITESWLKNYIPKKIKKVGKLFTLNMVEDHIHLLVSFPPTISIAEFVHKIKGSSSHYVNMMRGENSFYWQSGYGVLSLSDKGVPFVKKYIENQKEIHKNRNQIDILEYVPDDEDASKNEK